MNEIIKGGGVTSDFIDDINSDDHTNDQYNLFPHIPTLDPKLPKTMKIVGSIGGYRVVSVFNDFEFEGSKHFDYVLFDHKRAIGFLALMIPPKIKQRYVDLPGIVGQIGAIYIAKDYRGKRLGLLFYKWILSNVCDYLVADELHTDGGVKLWKDASNSNMFDVRVYDETKGYSRRRWSGKDFDQVYRYDHLIPWMTLRGKADIDQG